MNATAHAIGVALPAPARRNGPDERARISGTRRSHIVSAGAASPGGAADEAAPGAIGKPYWLLAAGAVIGVHVLAAGGRIGSSEPAPAPRHEVTVELVRPVVVPPQQKPEPPKPKPEPPKLVKKPTPAQPPPPALRTHAADDVIPKDAIVVAENTTAPITSAPVVSAPPAPPAPEPVKEEPVTEPNAYAAYLSNPPPEYPSFAQRQGWEGKVILRVRVLASGKPSTIDVKTSSGRKSLDDAAINAVRGWTFVPSKRGSTPIDGWATVPIEFKLSS